MLPCYLDRYAIPAEQALSSAGDPHGQLKGMLLLVVVVVVVVVETADASENIIKAKFSYLLLKYHISMMTGRNGVRIQSEIFAPRNTSTPVLQSALPPLQRLP
jgi:hypothetical protein